MSRGEKGSSRPYLRGGVYWIRYMAEGKERRESSKSSNKNDAIKLQNMRRSEIDDRSLSSSSATVGDLLDLYLADQRRQQRHSYHAAENYVRLHLRPALGRIKVSRITTGAINRFIELERERGLSNGSINRYLSALGRAFTLGK